QKLAVNSSASNKEKRDKLHIYTIMDADTEQEAQLNKIQSMKAAVHFTVGRICEEVGVELEMSFSKQVIATLTEITFKQLETYTKDLEAFSKHGRRTTITADDVKLLVRRNKQL
ncbi:unnamed protein product, partial [Meganyctiphanes norvegica]